MKNSADSIKTNFKNDPVLRKKVPPSLSRFLFCWILPLYGLKRDIEEEDLVPAKSMYRSKLAGNALEKKWHEEETIARVQGREPSMLKILIKSYWCQFLRGGIMQFTNIMLRTFAPLLFAQLLQFWSVNSTMTKETAIMYAVGLFAFNWIGTFCNHHGNLNCQQVGMMCRIATSTLMYRKLMRLNNASLGETASGKLVNILSNDMQRFDFTFQYLNYLWIIPIQLSVISYFGYKDAGVAALIGLATLVIIVLPIQGVLGRTIGKKRSHVAGKTDERIKVMTEVISGIQVIKMYAWEIPFQKVVGQKRIDELKEIKIVQTLRYISLTFLIYLERTAIFLTILAYILFGNVMSANVIYPLQQMIFIVQLTVTVMLPQALSFGAEVIVSIRRIRDFMILEDRPDKSKNSSSNPGDNFHQRFSPILGTSYKHTTYQHEITEEKVNGTTNDKLVRNLPHPGIDIAIELKNVSCSWSNDINNCTIKNVSLLIPQGKLCAIIGSVGSGKSSFLQLLLKELPALSGTVSVNGSVSYASQEAWLFPSTVRENILFGQPMDKEKYKRVTKVCCLLKDFKQFPYGDQTLVGEKGVALSGGQRARINLARSIYKESDVYLLDDPLSAVDVNVGRVLFDECINGYLRGRTRVLVTHQIHFLNAADIIVILDNGNVIKMGTYEELVSSCKEFSSILASISDDNDKDSKSVDYLSIDNKNNDKRNRNLSETEDNDDKFEAQKMQAEERGTGNLRWSVIKAYFRSGGNICFITLSIGMVALSTTIGASIDFWVSYWANSMASYEDSLDGAQPEPGLDVQVGLFTTGQYLIIHGCLLFCCILIANLQVFPLVSLSMNASKKLHDFMFSTMIKGVMRFFDTSSSGRILNRFTKDMGSVDEILPRTLFDVLQVYSNIIVTLILNVITLYWTIIPTIILVILFLIFVKIYMRTAQNIKRLESTSNVIVVGSVGLIVTQTTTLTAKLQYGTRMFVEFIAQLTSVERILEYTHVKTEENLVNGQIEPSTTWPSEGTIVFDNVSLRYVPEGVPVLKNLNVVIKSGWKVGIVGRTGAGKSSLISALFRFAFVDGKISIDGVDTALVARQELRSKFSIIPQEPVLFSATIRYNLDPFEIYSDAELWRALEQVDMKNTVSSLDYKITEGGSNFSVGQRQLLCLARAVLRSNKILIMDEATANVDPQTDKFIQETIKKHFALSTVLTIAHRLNTIMDSDKILVMSSGQAVEFDHPYTLLSDPNSYLSAMVNETGDNNAVMLFEMAKDAFYQNNLKKTAL
ncbi:hypothetical protein ACJJTC_008115 [Scirpophaga incertulas]